MTLSYLDTSAAMKLVVEERESQALVTALSEPSRRLAASWLLHTELHCAVGADEIVTYDDELARAATSAGVRVVAPG